MLYFYKFCKEYHAVGTDKDFVICGIVLEDRQVGGERSVLKPKEALVSGPRPPASAWDFPPIFPVNQIVAVPERDVPCRKKLLIRVSGIYERVHSVPPTFLKQLRELLALIERLSAGNRYAVILAAQREPDNLTYRNIAPAVHAARFCVEASRAVPQASLHPHPEPESWFVHPRAFDD